MPTNYPGSFDIFTNPTGGDSLNSPAVVHTDQHTNANDAILAIEVEMGINNSQDGNSMDYCLFGMNKRCTWPDDSTFSWVNQGTATIDTSGYGVMMTDVTQSGNNNNRVRQIAVGSTFTLTTFIVGNAKPGGVAVFGIGVRDSADTKLVNFSIGWDSGNGMTVAKYSDPSTFDSLYYTDSIGNWFYLDGTWQRIVVDSTNITFYYSLNGYDFVQIYQTTKNDYLTNIDRAYWFINNYNGLGDIYGRLLSWEVV